MKSVWGKPAVDYWLIKSKQSGRVYFVHGVPLRYPFSELPTRYRSVGTRNFYCAVVRVTGLSERLWISANANIMFRILFLVSFLIRVPLCCLDVRIYSIGFYIYYKSIQLCFVDSKMLFVIFYRSYPIFEIQFSFSHRINVSENIISPI